MHENDVIKYTAWAAVLYEIHKGVYECKTATAKQTGINDSMKILSCVFLRMNLK
jgi:hypothetical protein